MWSIDQRQGSEEQEHETDCSIYDKIQLTLDFLQNGKKKITVTDEKLNWALQGPKDFKEGIDWKSIALFVCMLSALF